MSMTPQVVYGGQTVARLHSRDFRLRAGDSVAIKVVKKPSSGRGAAERLAMLKAEVEILRSIRHPNVVQLFEVFESEKHFLMVMEYSGGGDLLQYVKKRKRLNEQSSKAIFKQILYALGHCTCT